METERRKKRHRRTIRRYLEPRDILDYCLSKPGAWLDYPYGPTPVCVKVGRRMFAQLYPRAEDRKITLNCTRERGEQDRAAYPETVTQGYHCAPVQRPYFNTVRLDGTVPNRVLLEMIDHAWQVVFEKHTRRERTDILAGRMQGKTSSGQNKPQHEGEQL